MVLNGTKMSSWMHKILTTPLKKAYAWYPTKMTSGNWVWLRDYWYHTYCSSMTLYYFKCSKEEYLILTLQGCIEDGKLSQAYERSVRQRHIETRPNRNRK